MRSNKAIVVLGIFAADTVYKAKRLPQVAETILGSGFSLGPGGKGSNQAIAAAKAGADVSFISRVGTDAFGQMARAAYETAGVRARILQTNEAPTGAAFVFIDEDTGDNAIIVAPGASGDIDASDIARNRSEIQTASIFLTQLEQPMEAALAGLRLAHASGVTTILNPAPARDLPAEIYGLCDYIAPNEVEARDLTGLAIVTDDDARAAANVLLARGARAVIITLGPRGVLYQNAAVSKIIPAFSYGPVVDTSGAGDAFLGGFACALSEGWQPEEAVRFGCATAAIAVSRIGTALAMPTRPEIERLLAANQANFIGARAVP